MFAVFIVKHRVSAPFFVRSIEMFEHLMKDDRISVLLSRQQKTLGHCLPLSAYLFKPVQRILKYHLLLQVDTVLDIVIIIIILQDL